jgi:hypothetical protein
MNNGDFSLDLNKQEEIKKTEPEINQEPVITNKENNAEANEIPEISINLDVITSNTSNAVKAEENTITSDDDIPVIEMVMPLEKVTAGRYRHYKGNEYEVVSLAKHSETLEKLVIYFDVQTHQYWARPYDMFIELVEKDGKFIRRFDKLS